MNYELFRIFAVKFQMTTMNRLQQAFVWLRRIGHCRGFGIQSPTDYRFVRYVINEHWPYYAYEELGRNSSWYYRKMGELYFRLANERQPRTIIDEIGFRKYLQAGCRKAKFVKEPEEVELAIVSNASDYYHLFKKCNDRSIVVIHNICATPKLWRGIKRHPKVTVTFDLYYCGIVLFDSKRAKQNYIINF